MKSTSSPRPLRAWWLAARPKTLSGALVPVVTGAALALAAARSGHVAALQPHAAVAGGLCALFAALMQIASNFINDLIDYRRGADGNDRLGPERACAQGWITPRAMTRGIVGILVLAALTGLALATLLLCALPIPPLTLLAGLVLTGATCMAGAFLYTTHLSRRALGDVLVFVFFGIVPVVGTFFALTGRFTTTAFLLGIGVGAMVDTLLVVNNLRDIDNDRRVGKRTLIVLIGPAIGSICCSVCSPWPAPSPRLCSTVPQASLAACVWWRSYFCRPFSSRSTARAVVISKVCRQAAK